MLGRPINFILIPALLCLSQCDLQLVNWLEPAKHCLIVSYTPEKTELSQVWTSLLTHQSSQRLIPLSVFTRDANHATIQSLPRPCNIHLVFTGSRKQKCIDFVRTKVPLAPEGWGTLDFFGLVNHEGDTCSWTKGFKEKDLSESKPMDKYPGNFMIFRVDFSSYESKFSISVRSVKLLKYFCSFKRLSCLVEIFNASATSAKNFNLLHVPNSRALKIFNGFDVQFHLADSSLTPRDVLIIQRSSVLELRMGGLIGSKVTSLLPIVKTAVEMGVALNFTALIMTEHNETIRFRRSWVYPRTLLKSTGKVFYRTTKTNDNFQAFLYCKQKQVKRFTVDAFAFFLPFDGYIWGFLCLSCLLMVAILWRGNSSNLMTLSLTILAPLLSQSHSLNCKQSSLTLLWCFFALLISSIYFGKFESFLVAPSAEKTMKTFKELAEKGYLITLRGKESKAYWMMCKSGKEGSFNGAAHLKKLRKTAVVLGKSHMKFMHYIAKTPKRATMNIPGKLDNYPEVLWKYHGVRCVKGTERLFTYGTYWLFRAPYSHILKESFDRLVSSGIERLFGDITDAWNTENDRLKWQKAYNDKVPVKTEKMISMTESHTSFSLENPQAAIIFFIFLICLAISSLAFLFQIVNVARMSRIVPYIRLVIQHMSLWYCQRK